LRLDPQNPSRNVGFPDFKPGSLSGLSFLGGPGRAPQASGVKLRVASDWPHVPIELLPQGFGREELLRRINLSPTAAEEADWRLLLAGAGNPIGNMRVKEAAQWLEDNAGASRGLTDAEVAQRGEDFAKYLASHGLFVAGSSGVQGEWPKVLLTRADDGLLYLDHTLLDRHAWIRRSAAT
jgi:serine/threonine protein kinase HipA of HipAB toxin-antitoxin module